MNWQEFIELVNKIPPSQRHKEALFFLDDDENVGLPITGITTFGEGDLCMDKPEQGYPTYPEMMLVISSYNDELMDNEGFKNLSKGSSEYIYATEKINQIPISKLPEIYLDQKHHERTFADYPSFLTLAPSYYMEQRLIKLATNHLRRDIERNLDDYMNLANSEVVHCDSGEFPKHVEFYLREIATNQRYDYRGICIYWSNEENKVWIENMEAQ